MLVLPAVHGESEVARTPDGRLAGWLGEKVNSSRQTTRPPLLSSILSFTSPIEQRPVLSLSYYDIERRLITRPREAQQRLPPFFSNLLPERDGALRDYLAQRAGINPEREFPLLWVVGADLPGAVIAVDSEGQPLPPAEEKSETREANKEEVLRFSLAGVQLKFSAIGRGGKQLRIPVQGRDGQWIVKLPSPRFPNVPENEFSMMTLGREVGIDIPEFGLISVSAIGNLPAEFAEDKTDAYFIRRFDRGPDGERIHAEDFNRSTGSIRKRNTRSTDIRVWRKISGRFSARKA